MEPTVDDSEEEPQTEAPPEEFTHIIQRQEEDDPRERPETVDRRSRRK